MVNFRTGKNARFGATALCALLAFGAGCRCHSETVPQAAPDLRTQAAQTMRKASEYFRSNVAAHGGYVYYYGLDLKDRWGEGRADSETIWVQPPGTPAVGMAYLKAYEATGDSFYLDAATDAAYALIYGQLPSGGWRNHIRFNPPKADPRHYYEEIGGYQVSSLDDDQSQSAIRFLAHVDKALNFRNREINQATRFALDEMMAAQFSNGAYPQGWIGPQEPRPVVKANYPTYDWRTENRDPEYWKYYTLNDNVGRFVGRTLYEAYQIYGDERYMASLRRLGDFFILAQMPAPQPGWAQQYNFDMTPVWARKFEPPAITGGESQGVMETLMDIYEYTGDAKYLEPVGPALEYYKSCVLPDGRLARYYELQTNKPLYMTHEYVLTYDDTDTPRHYGFKIRSRLDRIEKRFNELKNKTSSADVAQSAEEREQQVMDIINALDEQGRWIGRYVGDPAKEVRVGMTGQPKFPSPDFQFIASAVFNRSIEILSEYLIETKPEVPASTAAAVEATP